MSKYIYSETVGMMIPTGFVRKFSSSDEVRIGKEHFSWSESDCLYWSDEVDGCGYDHMDIINPYINWKGNRVDFIFD